MLSLENVARVNFAKYLWIENYSDKPEAEQQSEGRVAASVIPAVFHAISSSSAEIN